MPDLICVVDVRLLQKGEAEVVDLPLRGWTPDAAVDTECLDPRTTGVSGLHGFGKETECGIVEHTEGREKSQGIESGHIEVKAWNSALNFEYGQNSCSAVQQQDSSNRCCTCTVVFACWSSPLMVRIDHCCPSCRSSGMARTA